MKNKTTAALLAFFLGTLGGHKFYTEKSDSTQGITYLLCGTIGWLLIIPGLVICVLSIVDGIQFLSMSDQEFDKKYNKLHFEETKKSSDLDRLERLADLKEKGILTEEEFTNAKKEIKL